MIDKSTIDRIFAAADIVEVVGDYVTLKRKGVNYTACCPFHDEKTPSFIVSPAKGLYKCFGCGKGGNAVSFVMEHEKLSYPEALRHLAKRYNIEVAETVQSEEQRQVNDDRESMMVLNSWATDYFVEELSHSDVAYSYFRERGFTDQTISKFKLGYCPDQGESMAKAAIKAGFQEEYLERTGLAVKRDRGGFYDRFFARVMFPIFSISGRVIGFGGRTLRTDKKIAKYLNSPESEVYHKSYTLYGIHQAKRAITQLDRCILVEGYTDVIQMHQAGLENVVASSGTSLTQEQIRLIKRFTNNVTVIYDGDSAGIKASMRGIDMILKEGLTVRCVLLPDGEDPDSFARANSADFLKDFIRKGEVDFITFKTKLLLDDAQDDPIKRAELINDIIGTIALIPNEVEKQVFIRECSRLLDVPEGLLQVEVQRKKLGLVDGHKWYDNVRPKSQPLQAPDQKSVPILQEIECLERELIVYLIKYGDQTFVLEDDDDVELSVGSTILEEIQNLEIEFTNQTYSKIITLFQQNNNKISKDALINSEDSSISSFVTDVEFLDQHYIESRYWQRSEKVATTEKQRLSVAIPKALSVLFQKIIVNKINGFIAQLDQSELDSEQQQDIMKEIMKMNEIRSVICEKYERLI